MRGLTALGAMVLLAGSSAALASEPDPWARVPALPTACYTSDGYAGKLAAAEEAVARDIERQKAINQKLSDEVKSLDPMVLASRQQQYMMDHPQEAMALMQRNQALGTQGATDTRLASFDQQHKLDEELDAIDARYRAALAARFAPLEAKFKDLDVRASKDAIRGEGGDTWQPWAIKEWNALNHQRNAAYEGVCAEWWAASGPFHGWLTRYRNMLASRVPDREEGDAVGVGFMVIMAGTPQASFKSTAGLDAVDEFMRRAVKVFDKRWAEPRPDFDSGTPGPVARQ